MEEAGIVSHRINPDGCRIVRQPNDLYCKILVMTIAELKSLHTERQQAIRSRLEEFAEVWRSGDNARIFEELVFCIFTAGASARMGLVCIEKARPSLLTGTQEEICSAISRYHRYPEARAAYIVHTRDYLQRELDFKLKEKLAGFEDMNERRDFIAANPGIKGIGYKEASHFLRNIGFRGYAILDKHVLRSLHEFGVLDSPQPPSNRKKYLDMEKKMMIFADEIGIDFDELDLLLWSSKTGEILK